MEWDLEYGKFLGKYQLIYEKTGKKPTALAKQPEIQQNLVEYWNGYIHLDRSREWVYGVPLGIRYAEIDAYARIHRFSAEHTADFAYYVGKLDAVFLKWTAEHGKTRSNN